METASTPTKPQKSLVSIAMSAAVAMFQGIKGTRPRVRGWTTEGNMRFRAGTVARCTGAFGRNKAIAGGTPEYNQAGYDVDPKFLQRGRRERLAMAKGG
jgi:hypothetical protein